MPARPRNPEEAGSVERARAIAIALLARHAWSVAKMRERLLRRGVAEAAADTVIADLTRAGLLGDRAYAQDAARLELSRRPASDAFLEHKLVSRGVDERLAAREARRAAEGVSELDRARALARRNARPDPKDPAGARRRLLGLLARRGFDAETARTAVDETLGREPEDDAGVGGDAMEHHDEPI